MALHIYMEHYTNCTIYAGLLMLSSFSFLLPAHNRNSSRMFANAVGYCSVTALLRTVSYYAYLLPVLRTVWT